MAERAIFLRALELDDPKARSAYLDSVCANDPELRQRIVNLFLSHENVGSFLNKSAIEQLAGSESAIDPCTPLFNPESMEKDDQNKFTT
ncbi:MAG: hypothetical protein QM703_13315 [Gemmatales bacterium]